MQQVLAVWNSLDARKRIFVAVATVTMFAAVLGLARVAAQPSMALLYAGLEPGPAGEVISALEGRGVAMDVRGSAIYVQADRRDELRMSLAAEGLPSNSVQGYELLDNLSGFGTTSQMFDAAYWRAKEGELARTIVSSPLIEVARVHIATASAKTFRRDNEPSASVTVTTTAGSLSAVHAKALKFLVASAIPALRPENVAVIDSRMGLVGTGDDPAGLAGSSTNRAEALKRNVERLLEARVGYGNAVVEVSLDTTSESEKILERRFNPDERVAIATEVAETSSTSSETGSGAVTVASNLPANDGDGGEGGSNSRNTETRERVNYEVSETTREISRAAGTIQRISVAVLVDGIRAVNDAGEETWSARSEDELEALRELVAAAVGFDEARGDTISIETMEFQPITEGGVEKADGLLGGTTIDAMALARLAVFALVALVVGLFVLRPMFAGRGMAISRDSSNALPDADMAQASLPSLTGEIDDTTLPPGPEMATISDFDFEDEQDGTTGAGLPSLSSSDDPVDRLRALIDERQDETVEILRGWMEDEETA